MLQATVFNGGVRYVTITNRGTGYTSTPDIIFSSAPAIGNRLLVWQNNDYWSC